MLMIESKKSYGQLIEEMESLKGYKIVQGIELLKDTNYIFTQNYLELISKIDVFEKNPEFWIIENRQKLHFIILETRRLLHNYSSSVLTLIDHTRNFQKKISEKKIDDIYKDTVNRLNTHDVVIFMKYLRQYLQHYSLPIVNASFSAKIVSSNESEFSSNMDEFLKLFSAEVINRESIENKYVIEKKMQLDINELLKWNGWNSRSKDYLEEVGDEVEVKLFCEDYFNLVNRFYNFFYNTVLQEYKYEIIELEEFKSSIIEIYPSKEEFVRNLP